MQLENDFLRVTLDPATGGFVSIHDKRLNVEYVGQPGRALLFRLIVPEPRRLGRHVDAAAPQIAVDGPRATLRYTLDGIEAVATLELDADAVVARLQLTNNGALNVEETLFPYVRGLGAIPGGVVTLPNFGRRRIEDPLGRGWGGDHRHAEGYLHKMTARYPERMPCAWCDYSSAAGGVALEARHTDFSVVDFFLQKVIDKKQEPVRRDLDLAASHPRRVRPGESWQSPTLRIAVHPGDWHVPAAAHRDWLETWVQKADRSRKFAESPGWHYFFMKHQDGHEAFTYADLPRMAEAALAAGCPYIVLFGWHDPGHDNHYMYRYVANEDWGGDEALKEAVRKVRAMGVEPVPFFNGTLANIHAPEHREYGYKWEARTRDGFPYYAGDWTGFLVDAPTTNRSRIHHQICFMEGSREHFLKNVRRLALEYGFGNIQLDEISIKMYPCYDEAHGHATPDSASRDGIRALLPEVRRILREAYPQGIMLGEGTNVFTGQWCDGAWTWDLVDDPEPILYGAPWLLTSTSIDANEFGGANRAFAHKISFDLRINGGDELITDYPVFAAHVRALAGLRRRVADYYAYAHYRDREGIDAPADGAVIPRVFRAPDGKAAVVLAETAGRATDYTFTLSMPAREATLHSTVVAPRSIPLDTPLTTRLQPYEVQVICLD